MTEPQGISIRAAHPPRNTRRATQSIIPSQSSRPLGHPLPSQTLASQTATGHNPDTPRRSRLCCCSPMQLSDELGANLRS